MPKCGSQVILCDIPIRFDTYVGCSHACKYCFASKKTDISAIKIGETPKALTTFIEGKRPSETNWCDWNIPLHWGGMSDPFQPIEEKVGNSYECLKVLAKSQYPFVFSTKGKLVATDKYLKILAKCNCAGQVSITTKRFIEKFEPGAPSFDERVEMLHKLAPVVKRLIVRIQPYLPQFRKEALEAVEIYKRAGVYGVVVEGLKLSKKKSPCIERIGGDFCISLKTLKEDFTAIKAKCHDIGLKFFSGENRLRAMGDSLCCCGVDGIDGWQVNKANLNHIYFGTPEFTPGMVMTKTGAAFGSLNQTTIGGRALTNNDFKSNMVAYAKSSVGRSIYGI